MKAMHKIYLGVFAIAVAGLGINDLMNKDANALERVSRASKLEVDCAIKKSEGKRWGICHYTNGAPASAWLDRQGRWVAANGNAREVVDNLRSADTDNLPPVEVDYQSPPTLPAGLLQNE